MARGAAAAAPVPVRVAHAMAGRVRFRLAGALPEEGADAFADRVSACAGVRRVTVRPGPGTLIVEGQGTAEEIRGALEAAGVLKVLPPKPTIPLGLAARAGLDELDRAVASRTDGALDHRSALALLLLGASVWQAARGRLVGPAATLLVGALSLLEPRKR